MDSIRILITARFAAAWRHRWVGIGAAWLICVAGWLGVHAVPDRYAASARLYVDTDAVLTPLLHGLAADSSPSSQIDILQRTLLSRPNLQKLVAKTDLDLSAANPDDSERLLERLAREIIIVPQTANLFTIEYHNTNPRLAYDVVQSILTIFGESATGRNRDDMENARRFLEHQISSYEQQLRAAEKRRADFRVKYFDVLPADGMSGNSMLENARGQVRQLEGRRVDAVAKRDLLKQEVDATPPLLVVDNAGSGASTGPGGPVGSPKLRAAQEALAELKLKYTDQFPDVVAQKKLIAELEHSGGGTEGARPSAASGVKRSVPNPVYEQLKVRLIDAESDVASTQRQLEDAQAYAAKLEAIQRDQPGLQAEYQNLDRDYNVLLKSYDELLGRLQAANIGQAADTQADKVKLQIIDPPQVPRLPVSPNRPLLITGVLAVGVLSGVGLAVLLGQLDRSFSTVEELRTLGLPVLGGISLLVLPSLRQRLGTASRFGAVVFLLVVAYGGLMLRILRASALI